MNGLGRYGSHGEYRQAPNAVFATPRGQFRKCKDVSNGLVGSACSDYQPQISGYFGGELVCSIKALPRKVQIQIFVEDRPHGPDGSSPYR
jgi:hypothetical protein